MEGSINDDKLLINNTTESSQAKEVNLENSRQTSTKSSQTKVVTKEHSRKTEKIKTITNSPNKSPVINICI